MEIDINAILKRAKEGESTKEDIGHMIEYADREILKWKKFEEVCNELLEKVNDE